MTDLEAVRRGDREARERWIVEWWPRVYRMALAVTQHEADAEDLAQETMIAALGAVARFRGESSASTWLYAILWRTWKSRRRPAPVRTAPVTRPAETDDALALLAPLPEEQRIACLLYYVEGKGVEEIAEALGVPRATVRWRLFRARWKLRQMKRPEKV